MHSSFFNLFLGLLFQLDLYAFRGIDIFPDVLGYYFFYKGLAKLAQENNYFGLANKLVLPLAVLSLVKLYNFTYHPDLILSISYGVDIAKIILFALNMYFVYLITKGSIEIVIKTSNDRYLQRTILQRLYLFLGVGGLLLAMSIISLFPFVAINASLQSIFTIILFSYIFAVLVEASGIYNVYKLLSPAKAQPVKAKSGGKSAKSGQSKRKR